MPSRSVVVGCLAACVIIAVGVAFFRSAQPPPPCAATATATKPTIDNPLMAYRGKTVLLVMGMPGCPGTEKITAFFTAYAGTKPPQVELLRIDVPAPGGKLDPAASGPTPFKHQIDHDRVVAKALDFFSYPTFYVIDPDGVVRFVGPFDQTKVEAMVATLASEKPGGAKTMFSPPLPAVGSAAADFTGPSLAGTPIALREVMGKQATLLFFGSTTCPFSRQATQSLPGLAKTYADKGLGVLVINQGQKVEEIQSFYGDLGLQVVVDADDAISLGKYGVWAVPFCFVLDSEGKVLARQPFTEDTGKALVAKALGLSHDVVLPNAGAG